MSQGIEELWQELWNQYTKLNPSVAEIHKLIQGKSSSPILNDHVAFRTFRHPLLGIDSLAKDFLPFGYEDCGDYHFEQKKLYAKHFECKTDPNQPKVFISELKLEECSTELQSWVNGLLEGIDETILKQSGLSHRGRLWNAPNYADYQKHYGESEYAAWLSIFGFCANHFTVFVNPLGEYTDLNQLNALLESEGYQLNSSGGKIKGSPQDLLEQSSTMAHEQAIEFSDGESHSVPTVYYEFARRYPEANGELYQGFVAASADKIFESTNTSS